MRFTDIDVNFDITYDYDGHQKASKWNRKCFWAILVTFIFYVKIDINMCEPHYVNLLFFCEPPP